MVLVFISKFAILDHFFEINTKQVNFNSSFYFKKSAKHKQNSYGNCLNPYLHGENTVINLIRNRN